MNNVPNHIAIIPDGNRRWAKERGLPTFEGHRRGYEAGRKLVEKIRELGISTVTFWAFSTENWNRSKEEVGYLMKLYETFIDRNLEDALKEKVKIIHLGRKDRIPKSLLKKINQAEEKTKGFKEYYLNIALDYGGHDEIIRAIQRLKDSNFKVQSLTAETFGQFLDTNSQPYPNPDLIIRTSDEERLSGFMPWQSEYSEFYFADCYFPDFNEEELEKAIHEYAKRKRNFGR